MIILRCFVNSALGIFSYFIDVRYLFIIVIIMTIIIQVLWVNKELIGTAWSNAFKTRNRINGDPEVDGCSYDTQGHKSANQADRFLELPSFEAAKERQRWRGNKRRCHEDSLLTSGGCKACHSLRRPLHVMWPPLIFYHQPQSLFKAILKTSSISTMRR